MKKVKTIAFYLFILILLVAGMSIDLSARNYPRKLPKLENAANKHENRKQHRIYYQRADKCRNEQLKKQSSGTKSKVVKYRKSKLFR